MALMKYALGLKGFRLRLEGKFDNGKVALTRFVGVEDLC